MSTTTTRSPAAVAVERLDVAVYTIPTDAPEADGTLAWTETTIVVVRAHAGDRDGLGYTYSATAAAELIRATLAPLVLGADALAPQAVWRTLVHETRNLGRPGLVSAAIAAIDTALWDLHARLLDLPLCDLLGPLRETVPLYGSGGFTSYAPERLQEQLAGWVEQGLARVKMKVGSDPDRDPARVRRAREAVGPDAELMVDANGAYERTRALALAERFHEEAGVTWFEEPVSSEDLDGLRLLRDRAPAGMAIAAGEYGWQLADFRALLDAGAVDVLQADVTRCAGITELLRVDALCGLTAGARRQRGPPDSSSCVATSPTRTPSATTPARRACSSPAPSGWRSASPARAITPPRARRSTARARPPTTSGCSPRSGTPHTAPRSATSRRASRTSRTSAPRSRSPRPFERRRAGQVEVMQATAFLAVAIVVGFFAAVVFGAAWFIAVPVAFLAFLVPVAFVAALAARKQDRTRPTGAGAMPSSQEASYEPIVDPAERPTTR